MTTMTVYDLRVTDHRTRTDRVNRHGWIWQVSPTAGVAPPSRTTTVIAPIRQRIGGSIVRVGEWLRGAPTGHVADRAAV